MRVNLESALKNLWLTVNSEDAKSLLALPRSLVVQERHKQKAAQRSFRQPDMSCVHEAASSQERQHLCVFFFTGWTLNRPRCCYVMCHPQNGAQGFTVVLIIVVHPPLANLHVYPCSHL